MLLDPVEFINLVETGSFGHEIMQRHLAIFALPKDKAGVEENGCEPERGA